MSVGMIVSSIVLGMSLIASGMKLVDWLLTSDPRQIIRLGRRFLWVLAAAAVPGSIMLLFYGQWTAAMLAGSFALAVPAALHWRSLVPQRRFRPIRLDESGPADPDRGGDFGDAPPDPELVRRAAIVLQDYLAAAGRPAIAARPRADAPAGERMDADEARAVLGLGREARSAAIRAAHRRLVQLVHPDRGGTNYLAAKINLAKDVLLAEAAARPARGRSASSARTVSTPRADEADGR